MRHFYTHELCPTAENSMIPRFIGVLFAFKRLDFRSDLYRHTSVYKGEKHSCPESSRHPGILMNTNKGFIRKSSVRVMHVKRCLILENISKVTKQGHMILRSRMIMYMACLCIMHPLCYFTQLGIPYDDVLISNASTYVKYYWLDMFRLIIALIFWFVKKTNDHNCQF